MQGLQAINRVTKTIPNGVEVCRILFCRLCNCAKEALMVFNHCAQLRVCKSALKGGYRTQLFIHERDGVAGTPGEEHVFLDRQYILKTRRLIEYGIRCDDYSFPLGAAMLDSTAAASPIGCVAARSLATASTI